MTTGREKYTGTFRQRNLFAGIVSFCFAMFFSTTSLACEANSEIVIDKSKAETGISEVSLCKGYVQLFRIPGKIDVVIVGDNDKLTVNVLTTDLLAVTAIEEGDTNLVVMYDNRKNVLELPLTIGTLSGKNGERSKDQEIIVLSEPSTGGGNSGNQASSPGTTLEGYRSILSGEGENDQNPPDYHPPHRIILYRGTKIEVIECQPACTGI